MIAPMPVIDETGVCMPISVGTFTKGLGFADLARNLAELSLFVPALPILSLVLLRKQEK